MARGELAPEHDPDLVAWVFTTLTTEFGLHLMRRLQAEHGEFEAAELRERSDCPGIADQSLEVRTMFV